MRAIPALFMLLIACGPHSGTGVGELRSPAGPNGALVPQGKVTLRWTSSGIDTSTGDIEADLPDGRLFNGTFVQPRSTEWRDNYNVYWGAWTGAWGRAGPWYSGPRSNFVTHYAQATLAHLESHDGTRMRCRFDLYKPDQGMLGGGQGDCQLSTNEDVFDAVLERKP